MDITGSIGFVAKAALCRKIQFVKYAKPHVVEYPTNAIVLNPNHTARRREALAASDPATEQTVPSQVPLSHRERRPKGADDDDPRYQPDDELICRDARFYDDVLCLGWQNALRHGGVGAGLVNQGNTCFLNSVLQAIAHTPPIAQYLATNFKSQQTNAAPTAPIDFAFYLADVTRRILGVGSGGQHDRAGGGGGARAIKPSGIVGNLRGISKTLKVGQQADAHEFYVYLIQAVQASLLFRYNGGKKVPLKVSASTPLLRVMGGYLRSQVAWSRNDELTMLRRAHQTQAAADLEMGRATHPSDRLYSNTYDPFTVMSLTIAGHTLEHCLDDFCRVEALDGRCYQSPRKVGVKATKCFRIHIPPPVLCIQLKRFDAMRAKVSKKIVYPAVLDVAKWCSEGLKEYGGVEANTVYDLCAVVVHEGGSLSYGHYIAIVKLRNNLWAVCNDESVRVIPEDVALRQQAYMLFYAKRAAPSAEKPRHATADKGLGVAQATGPALTASVPPMSEGRQLTDAEVRIALAERRARQAKEEQQSPRLKAQESMSVNAAVAPVPAKHTNVGERRRYVDEDGSNDDEEGTSAFNRLASNHQNDGRKSASPAMRPSASPHLPPTTSPRGRVASAMGSPRLAPSAGATSHGMYDGIKAAMRQRSASPRRLPPSAVENNEAPEAISSVEATVGVAQLMGADAAKALRQSKDQNKHTTIQRPRHFEKMRTRSRDEQWDAVMDAGRVKKVRRREEANEDDANGERPNRFQSNGLSFDLRGRRLRGRDANV